MIKRLVFIFLLFGFSKVMAQELNARVTILTPQVSNINKATVDVLQKTIRDFLNNNKFSNESYQAVERISCNFVITITSWDGGSGYTGEAQIQSSRPVYNSSYNSTLLNMSDKNFDFNFNDGATIDFSDQTFISNISSLLTYYAYTIIGLDKDSFSKMGGTIYFKKAQNIINLAQTSPNLGWKAVDGLRNRFWFNENTLNPIYGELRNFIYNYHFGGLDQLTMRDKGLMNILNALPALTEMDKQKLGSIFPNVYFASKAEEITNVLAKLQGQDRVKAYNMLVEVDPANIGKYELLRKN
ncbi:type IX secretion system protein PorD [Pedobacter sp. MW01-1-1]|uniref:type IX secretion system protein PorD n=1 Tax=Pedobacter sp. MW01-1-1 TaxID=3383027 RepID=UPI003FED3D15